jgi:hypothetical protein
MNWTQTNLAALAVTLLGLVLAPDADARSASGWSGKAQDPKNVGCFSESFGSITNSSCSGTPEVVFPLIADAPGAWTVVVDVTPTSATSSVLCRAFGFAQDNASYSYSQNTSPSIPNQSQTITLAVPNVPMWGSLYLECALGQGARVNGVNWYQ